MARAGGRVPPTVLAPRADAQVRPGPTREVVMSAAVSLTEVLQQLAPIYQAKTGDARRAQPRRLQHARAADRVRRRRRSCSSAPTKRQMNAVAAQIDPRSRVDLLSNQLAIAVPDDRPRTMASARDLLDPAIRRIAIGDPAAVPAGVYAQAVPADARHLARPAR